MFSRSYKLTGLGPLLSRSFTTTRSSFSNIGKSAIPISESVQCFTEEIPYEFCKTFRKGKSIYSLNRNIVVKGPKGSLKMAVPSFVSISQDNNYINVKVEDPEDRIQRSMWGTSRATIQNHVIGTTEGHIAIVKFVGTGFRAVIEDGEDGKKYVALRVGFPYIPKVPVPDGITVSCPNPTRLLVEGLDKQQVKLFAARIREFKKPEPYKGKGIYVDDEKITLKEKKIK
ncbi:Piso0_005823 [Millerozyma farinosa CBS 7064]|uniref:Piso0_005823 protein n=1 Tax=Pichia sorbitophila (strain ATCC MYA-4447 / BCRC 22081 / CBS 7064 / NBRC 10061 / NRRL Y-12695) TaxID=559304 RepID=G8Y018_PICSO|nr:Piso0_005823 [Millerozyma farinosa CBS 7064]